MVSKKNYGHQGLFHLLLTGVVYMYIELGGGFECCFLIFTPTWGNDPIWRDILYFFQMGGSTTNYIVQKCCLATFCSASKQDMFQELEILRVLPKEDVTEFRLVSRQESRRTLEVAVSSSCFRVLTDSQEALKDQKFESFETHLHWWSDSPPPKKKHPKLPGKKDRSGGTCHVTRDKFPPTKWFYSKW